MNSPHLTPEPTPGYWVHNLDPFLVHFPEGWPLEGVRWYGLAYVAGFLTAHFLLCWYDKTRKFPLDADRRSWLMIALFAGVLIGGRLGYIIGYELPRNPTALLENPLMIFHVNKGGMASHGGMVGVWVALAVFAWRCKVRFWALLDVVVSATPPGIFFGRIANFINGELWGRETSVSWAVVFRRIDAHGREWFTQPRHPSQLYAAALEGLLPLVWLQWRFWRGRLPEGQLVGEAMVGYALVRIFGELFREPDEGVGLVLGLSRGQFYSVFLALAGVAVIVWARGRRQKQGVAGTDAF